MPNGFLPSLSYLYKLRAIVMTAFTGYMCMRMHGCVYTTSYNHAITYNECLLLRYICANMHLVYLQ